jgi:uncharacterized protein (DUF58 family)
MLFPGDFLTRLEYLSIVSKRVFRGKLLAQRRTMQLGSGIEFSDHREYAMGDDFRYLDWNVYARHGDLLLKRFEEEEDLSVYLLLDCSRSMGFGKPAKFDLARQLVAALAYIALADLDRVALFSFASNVVTEFPLGRGKARILPIMRHLEDLAVAGDDTNLGDSVREVVQRNSRSGLAVVVSDLFDPQGFQRGLDQLRYHRFDVRVIQVFDPLEADPKMLGDVELVDVETAAARKVTVTERNIRAYKQLFTKHQQAVRDYCRNYGLGCNQDSTSAAFDEIILRMMRETGAATVN